MTAFLQNTSSNSSESHLAEQQEAVPTQDDTFSGAKIAIILYGSKLFLLARLAKWKDLALKRKYTIFAPDISA